jgi:glycosyltransferase involved in cell wall biosynthesis
MKILQVHNFYRTRGGECGVVDAEKRLLESHGHTVTQFVADSNTLDKMTFSKKASIFLQIPSNSEIALRLKSCISEHRPDLAHVHNVFPMLSPSVYVALRRDSIPVVQTVHNYRFLCPNGLFYVNGKICEACQVKGYWEAVRNRCMHGSIATSALYAAAIAWGWHSGAFRSCVDLYVVLNAFVAEKLMAGGVPAEKIRVCGNFVSDFAESPVAKKPYALYLGRLSSEKGLFTLIAAARSVPELPLKIAGTGPLEGDLRRAVREPGMEHIELIGHVSGESKRRLIAEALYTVVPSEWYENFPLSVVESLALGTPVIASRIGGLPELIKHEHTGLLFPAGDMRALAECLRRIIHQASDIGEMAANALATAREQFSPQRHLEQLLTIYADAVYGVGGQVKGSGAHGIK